MSQPTAQLRFANEALASGGRLALYASAVLWVADIGGNIPLFIVRPARHWPALESVETLYLVSLIPIALLLHRLNRQSPLNAPLTIVGILGIVGAAAISIGFVTELAAFGSGFIGGPAYFLCEGAIYVWLLGANAVAWRTGKLPGITVPLALLYAVWAVLLARTLTIATKS
jgi:hypothetical protein